MNTQLNIHIHCSSTYESYICYFYLKAFIRMLKMDKIVKFLKT